MINFWNKPKNTYSNLKKSSLKFNSLIIFGAGLLGAVFFSLSQTGAAYACPATQIDYPNGCTASWTSSSGDPTTGPVSYSSQHGAGQFLLWDSNSDNLYNTNDKGKVDPNSRDKISINGTSYLCTNKVSVTDACWWGVRSTGASEPTSTYVVIAPKDLSDSGVVDLTINNACKAVSDSVGWEDASANPPNTVPLISNFTASDNNNSVSCANNGSNPNLVLPISNFTSAPGRYGYSGGQPMAYDIIQVTDNSSDASTKTFSMSFNATNGYYISPATNNTGGGYTNIQDPAADYATFNNSLPDPCLGPNIAPKASEPLGGSNESYCPNAIGQDSTSGGYGIVNQPLGPQHNYTFQFQPDCSAVGQTTTSGTFTWRNQGNTSTQDSSAGGNQYEYWSIKNNTNGNVTYSPMAGANGSAAGEQWLANNTSYPTASYPFSFKVGDSYTWTWYNVSRAHGLSVQLPFSEYTDASTFDCNNQLKTPNPTGGVNDISADCTQATIYGEDTAYPSAAPINYQLYTRNNKDNNVNLGLNDGNEITELTSGQFQSGNPIVISPSNLQSTFLLHPSGGPNYTLVFYLRIQDPVNGIWYWVKAANSLQSIENPITTNKTEGPDGIYDSTPNVTMTYTRQCPQQPPPGWSALGYINGTSCVNQTNGLDAVWGWVEDESDLSYHPEVQVKYQTSANPGVTYDYNYESNSDGYYTADQSPLGVPAGYGFNIPADNDPNQPIGSSTPDLLDGYTYTFYVYAERASQANFYGLQTAAGGGTPGTVYQGVGYGDQMTSCSRFTVTDNSTVSLSPDDEDPTSYSTTAAVSVAYNAKTEEDGLYNQNFDPASGLTMLTCNITDKMLRTGDADVLLSATPPSTNPYDCTQGETQITYQKGSNPIDPSGNPYGPTLSGLEAGDQYCPFMDTTYGDTALNVINADGTVLVNGGSGGGQGLCDTVDNKPFFKVYGSGVRAISDFPTNTDSTCSGGGVLDGWDNDSGTYKPYDFGTSVQYETLSLGQITGVASGLSGLAGSNNQARSPSELSFANNVTDVSAYDAYEPSLGGTYTGGSGTDCPVSITASTSQTQNPYESQPLDEIPSGSYTETVGTGTKVAIPGGTIANGVNISIFITGDAEITNNITYSDANAKDWTATTLPPSSNVPSVTIVATGNIYIDSGVTNLDGTYISDNADGTGGNIYTCSDSSGAVSSADQYSTCNEQLEVNGQMEANDIHLERTFGSLRDEKPPEPTGPVTDPNGSIQLESEFCGEGAGAPGIHFYQAAGVPAVPAIYNGVPPSCVNDNDQPPMYVLPTNNIQPGELGLYFMPRNTGTSPGDNYYTTEPDQATANSVAHELFGDPSATLVGYVIPVNPATGTCDPAWQSDSGPVALEPMYKFYDAQYNYYTANPNEQGPLIASGNGIVACVLTQGDKGMSTTIPPAPTAPVLTSCSNEQEGGVGWVDQNTCAAEVFNFTPEVYLGRPPVETETEGGDNSDSITSLPPVF